MLLGADVLEPRCRLRGGNFKATPAAVAVVDWSAARYAGKVVARGIKGRWQWPKVEATQSLEKKSFERVL